MTQRPTNNKMDFIETRVSNQSMISDQSLNAFTETTDLENHILQYEEEAVPQELSIEDFVNEDGELDMEGLLQADTGDIPILDILSEYYYRTTEEIVELRTEISEIRQQRKDMEEEEKGFNLKTVSVEFETAALERELYNLKQNSHLKSTLASTIENVDNLKEKVTEIGSKLLMNEEFIVTNNIVYNLFPQARRYGSIENISLTEDEFHPGGEECGNKYSNDDFLPQRKYNSYKNIIPDMDEIYNFLQDDRQRKNDFISPSCLGVISKHKYSLNSGIKQEKFIKEHCRYMLVETLISDTDEMETNSEDGVI